MSAPATVSNPTRREDPAPDRPCDDCGRRDGWRRLRSGAWACTCPRAVRLDDHGLPQIMRHSCDKIGCRLAAEDEDAEPAAPPFVTVATITVMGPVLLRCPRCRAWTRLLEIAENGAQACVRCAG